MPTQATGSDHRPKTDSEQESEGEEFSTEADDDFDFKPKTRAKRVNFAERRISIADDSSVSSRISVLSYDEDELKDDIAPLGQLR